MDAEKHQGDDEAEDVEATRAGLGDLLGGLLGGGAGGGATQSHAGPDLGGIQGLLGAMGGGGLPGIPEDDAPAATSPVGGASAEGMDLGALLAALSSGDAENASTQNAAPAGMDLGALLGGLAEGGAGSSAGGGLDIGSLMGGLLGGDGGQGGFGGLLGGLLGGQEQSDAVSQPGMGATLLQAALPLVLGALTKRGASRSGGINDPAEEDIRTLVAQARISDVPDVKIIQDTAAARRVAATAGVDLQAAAEALQDLIAALTGKSKAKPRKRPQASAAKPKPASSAKPKPAASVKPKPATSAKPKPKPAAKPTTKPKPAAKPTGSTKPKTSGKRPATGTKRSTGGG